jgi:hypothetical protein
MLYNVIDNYAADCPFGEVFHGIPGGNFEVRRRIATRLPRAWVLMNCNSPGAQILKKKGCGRASQRATLCRK